MDPSSTNRRIPREIVQWLLLIAATFVVGCLAIVVVPHHQSTVVDIGVFVNIAMAVGVGVVLAWTGRPQQLCCAVGLGAVVTVLGWDGLTITQGAIQAQGSLGVVLLDLVALPVAAVGMAVLVGGGAAIGGIGRLLYARCPCRRWQSRFGFPAHRGLPS